MSVHLCTYYLCTYSVYLLPPTIDLDKAYPCKLQVPLVSNFLDLSDLPGASRIRDLLLNQVSSIGNHELVPDPEVVTSVQPWPEDCQ